MQRGNNNPNRLTGIGSVPIMLDKISN